jgi:DNA-binding LacI/PurR family transcriptional regulator
VPYVGVDYPTATAALVRRGVDAGHRRFAYVGEGSGPESHADRKAGFDAGLASGGVEGVHLTIADRRPDQVLDEIVAENVTAVFVEEYADGVILAQLATGRGLTVPGDLSFVTLGDPTRPTASDRDFTGFRIPRREMGWQAVEILSAIVEGRDEPTQRMLPCEIVDGSTLAPPTRAQTPASPIRTNQ